VISRSFVVVRLKYVHDQTRKCITVETTKKLNSKDIENTLIINSEQITQILIEWVEQNFQNSKVEKVAYQIDEPSKFTPTLSSKLSGVNVKIIQNNT